jgi:squalene-hopene/tetraprenyl-beta-curcumene cyclase
MSALSEALANAERVLRGLKGEAGHWRGELASSALATATALVAMHEADAVGCAVDLRLGVGWLVRHQNEDGGWGDTPVSMSNLSTTLLCLGALRHVGGAEDGAELAVARAEAWVLGVVGSLEAGALQAAVVGRYGKDKTFSVPILMLCAICGLLGEGAVAWRRVLPLPFELAALPRAWFGRVGLPVVSYALPALIAIGHARFRLAPPAWWNPLRWLRWWLWRRIRPMLAELQPSSGGYLEATPLTSFVSMALAVAGERDHPCLPLAMQFLRRSRRADGAWPIDTDLATWGTTLAVKSGLELEEGERVVLRDWLLGQQYREVHPFTMAAPGGWAWTDLPGGVPDADDTPGALLALRVLRQGAGDEAVLTAVLAGVRWLLDLQNRDGGVPTFCRGWGTLPFDRSTPELTAHGLAAWWVWRGELPGGLVAEVDAATRRGLGYLRRVQRANGSWVPLWFGNEAAMGQDNPVYGTAQVLWYLSLDAGLAGMAGEEMAAGVEFLLGVQNADGSWGGDVGLAGSVEETAVVVQALLAVAGGAAMDAGWARRLRVAAEAGGRWLLKETDGGRRFVARPIGLYFARLWYYEQLYPVVWTVGALRALCAGEGVGGVD